MAICVGCFSADVSRSSWSGVSGYVMVLGTCGGQFLYHGLVSVNWVTLVWYGVLMCILGLMDDCGLGFVGSSLFDLVVSCDAVLFRVIWCCFL